MRKISVAIVGAGQAGLGLGFELLKTGRHSVSIFTNKNAAQVRNGKIMSSQGMFNSSLRHERRLGLNFWDRYCLSNKAVSFTLATPGAAKKMISWSGLTAKPYQSVDQRIKFSHWMDEFQRLGGQLQIADVGLSELDKIAKWHELTIVAGGKGEISQAFPRNNVRSHFDKPQRALACLYVDGVVPDEEGRRGVHANIIPGIGEFFIMPGLTLNNKSCEMMLFEGIPGGPLDCWNGLTQPDQQLEKALELLKKYVPWEAERCKQVQLTDNNGTLTGRYTPVVRHPVIKMPCGKSVLGIGDTVVLNDPVGGQGANNAAKATHLYATRIDTHDGKEFDESWMRETFELYWNQCAKWATKWTHLLLMPPAPHVIELLKAAETSPIIASTIADGFDDPSTLFPWIMHPEDTSKFIRDIKESEDKEKQEAAAITGTEARLYSYGFRP